MTEDVTTVKYADTITQKLALNNITAVLEAAGSSLRNIVKVNVFLKTMDDFAAMNEGWDEIITWEPKPVCAKSSRRVGRDGLLTGTTFLLIVSHMCCRISAAIWDRRRD